VCFHPSVSLNKEKVCREISEDNIAVCEKTQGLRSGNFSDLILYRTAYIIVLFVETPRKFITAKQ
jgi:hypothetical protein